MTIIEAIILGIIQGLTEFLPISSSGHIELGTALLQVESEENLLFSIVVHGATALSTVVVFRRDIAGILEGLTRFEKNDAWDYTFKILVSMIPVGLAGVLFKDQIETFFGGRVVLVGSMLLITGSLLALTFFAKPRTGGVTFPKAFVIGIAQMLAIMPGISRSGATIATSILIGVERNKAARFSFLMVLIPILGATMLQFKDLAEKPGAIDSISFIPLIAGFIASFLAGVTACQWMVRIVRRGKLIYFAIYCFIIGSIAIINALI